MSFLLPDYLRVSSDQLGDGTSVRVSVVADMQAMAVSFATAILDEIRACEQGSGKPATFIIPVGPVEQFPLLAAMINAERIDCRNVLLINMDEYLTDGDRWIDAEHPLSFRGYMQRLFYDRVNPELAPLAENRVFPDPQNPQDIQKLIDRRGGVDACFGGIGINGHIAFNEPPEAGEPITTDQFAMLPTRSLELTRETRTINSVTVGGEIAVIPRRAVTVGMKECLGARKLRFFCNRPWQSAVVRRVLHGPVTALCPASLLRTHADASITVTQQVADLPEIKLR